MSTDISAQKIANTGDILWTSGGVAVSTAVDIQWSPELTPDGNGGAIIVWTDERKGANDIYAQGISTAGRQ